MSDAPAPMAATAPAPVRRLKLLSFAVAGLAALTLILGLEAGFGESEMTPLVLGLIGPVLYVVLAFQVQAHKNWARIWIAVLAMLGTLGGVNGLSTRWELEGPLPQLGPGLQMYIVGAFVITLLSAVLLVLIIIQAFNPWTIAWCQPGGANQMVLANQYAQQAPVAQQYPGQPYPPPAPQYPPPPALQYPPPPALQYPAPPAPQYMGQGFPAQQYPPPAPQYPALEYPAQQYPPSDAVPSQAAARQHFEPQFGDVPSQWLPDAPAQVPEAVSDHVESGESAAVPVSSPSVPDSEFFSSRWAPPEPGIVDAPEPVTAAIPTPEPVLPTPPSQGRRHS